jgi:hypothetical protein
MALTKPRNHGKEWTEDDLWYLAEEYVNGKELKVIAWTLGRTSSACASMMRNIIWSFKRKDMFLKMTCLDLSQDNESMSGT